LTRQINPAMQAAFVQSMPCAIGGVHRGGLKARLQVRSPAHDGNMTSGHASFSRPARLQVPLLSPAASEQ
jgi:hypothetical protein